MVALIFIPPAALPGKSIWEMSDIRTIEREVSLRDFLKAYKGARFPIGKDDMAFALLNMRRVERNEPIPYKGTLGRMWALCKGWQLAIGNNSFFLSARKASEILNIAHMTANRKLRKLVQDDWLVLVHEYPQHERKANAYRFVDISTGELLCGNEDDDELRIVG